MKYPTCEYRKLLCLYQQLQQPEPVLFSRSLREHHLLFLSNTPMLILYFTRQGKRYWLVNEYDCLGLKPFRYPAGAPGHFFTRTLKNRLGVKLHWILDNNAAAVNGFVQALIRQTCRLFDMAVEQLDQPSSTTFAFYRTVTVRSSDLPAPTYRGIFGHCPHDHQITLTLCRNGFGVTTVHMTLHYQPLPFAALTKHYPVRQSGLTRCLTPQDNAVLKSLLMAAVSDFVGTFFHIEKDLL